MKTKAVLDKLRELKIIYAQQQLWHNPQELSEHLAEFLGYATILYSHYGIFMNQYRELESKILIEETEEMTTINQGATKREDRRTAAEKEDRITIRINKVKGEREMLEAEVKAATLHINGIQSLLRRFSDEAKGIS